MPATRRSMEEATFERTRINITEIINFKEADKLLKELEVVLTQIEEITNRKDTHENFH